MFIQCSVCGGVVGVMDLNSTRDIIHGLESALNINTRRYF